MFSPFMKAFYHDMCFAGGCKEEYRPYRKLMLTHFDKQYYVYRYNILKFHLKMRMQLVRIGYAIRFRQKRFIET